ncbi:hypothetical protein pEaSNUABM13_00167 [Erwinia phage pEa_SNUABM_13]|nr:hypothetical protein pEaSNUABM13_00167 [Erwinia phage pEa_SNUABM_13]
MTTLVIYHQGCADGSFAAAITALARSTDDIHYLPAHYAKDNAPIALADGTAIEDMVGVRQSDKDVDALYKEIIIVDFSLTERQMAVLTQRYQANFVVLDHHNCRSHELYAEECRRIGAQPLQLTFTAGGSGALLAYFHHISRFQSLSGRSANNVIRMAQLVSDYDTWQRQNKRAFFFYDGHAPETFKKVEPHGVLYVSTPSTVERAIDVLVHGDIEQIITRGQQRAENREQKFQEHLNEHAFFSEANEICHGPHVVVPAGRGIGSQLAAYVYENHNRFHTVIMPRLGGENKDRVYISVRSGYFKTGAESGSAKHTARLHGGDGHANAAGFNVSLDEFVAAYPTIDLNVKFDHEQASCAC